MLSVEELGGWALDEALGNWMACEEVVVLGVQVTHFHSDSGYARVYGDELVIR